MGRPEPSVLFSQTFVHPHLDEYVDEVLFAEPIVITACEFLEQNASSAAQAVLLVGATSPPSFALEVFVQCEGETRFRRLCQPFLYSHSSSNVLEVEAVVTNHLVVRGSYRSLSLVIYGNTAEDLGQFNIEFNDNSLTNLVSSAEGKLEDLPLALHSTHPAIEESISSLKALSLSPAASDILVEVKQVLQLLLRILELPELGVLLPKVVNTVVSAASFYAVHDSDFVAINQKHYTQVRSKNYEELQSFVNEAREELHKVLQTELGNSSVELLAEGSSNFEADLVTSKQLVDSLSQYFHLDRNSSNIGHHQLSKNKNDILGLSVALFLCSGKESCFHFIDGGGMDQLTRGFSNDMHNSTTSQLLLLGVIEQATRYSIGCEGFLGWWPRQDENVPSSTSDGYSHLLKLLLQKPRHDVASLATYVLHRLRFYEVASRYECAVVSVLEGLSAVGEVISVTLKQLTSTKSQLEKLLKLLNFRGPIEDPSTVASASRSLVLGQTEGGLSYKATSSLIASSNGCFLHWDIDSHLLEILKERGFLPLSAALLSSSILHYEAGHTLDILMDIASTIEAIVLSLLSCRSGLIFLLQHSELSATVIHALKGADELNKEECVPLRYASVLISKGFICAPRAVGMTFEMHLRVVNAIDRLLTSTRHSEEFLWVLWELCGLSRSDCGRQALLALGYFPEAMSILIEALHSVNESETAAKNSGASPLNLAILHSAAEIFEVIVTDSTASSLASWIEYAVELHEALHSSSPGSNRKDAPTRLLEWIDAGVVYHKNGAIGLLRYAAVLASGGDAHLTSTSVLVSDMTDVEVIGDSSGVSDINVMDNLGKIISEKSYDGVGLRDSSIAQLTTAFRILAFISENSTVAAILYDEGAISVIYAVLVNCRLMLERSSNNYDHLVDEGTERNSTSDLLLERNREQSLVDLLVPALVLLITLLQKLQEANEQHRNTKLMNALLRLHRELSPKLAACAADLSSPYPASALGFGAVCHLFVSALACWPVYGWSPGLFHSLLDKVHATSLLALGPKETCSLLCLLNDLFPEEGVWLWKNEMPMLSALRKLTVGTLLGPHEERLADWYMKPAHLEKILAQLTPCLDKIGQIIQHYAISALVVIQDMLRVFVIRIACQKVDGACVLLRPILTWIYECVSDFTHPSDTDAYKAYRFLDFLSGLLEHPRGKVLLSKEGVVDILAKVMERCFDSADSDGKQISDIRNATKSEFTMLSWCLPVFKCFTLLCCSRTPQQYSEGDDLCKFENLSAQDCSLILLHLLKFCQVLPVGQELLACVTTFRELSSCNESKSAFMALISQSNAGTEDFSRYPPLLCCWKKLLRSVNSRDGLSDIIETVDALSLGCLQFCMDGKGLNSYAVDALKFLFGIPDDTGRMDESPEDNINYIQELVTLLSSKTMDDYSPSADMETILGQVSLSLKSLFLLLQKPTGSVSTDDIVIGKGVPSSPDAVLFPSKTHQMSDAEKADDYLCLGGFGEKFLWECPETDRLSQATLAVKRKMAALDGTNRRGRGDNSPAETASQTTFSRGLGPSTAPPVPTRRDTFRQRKPNTSRPPSMHVDDYVARERNVDSVTNSNVIAVQRVGSTNGRPPSIHVDEFMARQRERQNPTTPLVGEVPPVQVKNARSAHDADTEKPNKSKQLKPDLDDDLQGIDIVFDGEESETDDKLPFPQPDDILQHPAPVIIDQSSPHSIVAETESDANENSHFSRMGTPLGPNADETAQSEFSSRMSVSRPEIPLTREPSVSSEKKYFEQSDDKKPAPGFESAAAATSSGFRASAYKNTPGSSVQPADSRMNSQNMYQNSPQHMGTGSQGPYERKFMHSQPPLPPMPPPSTAQPVLSQTPDRFPSQSTQQPIPSAFQGQNDYMSAYSNTSTSLASSHPMPDLKYSSGSSPGGSARLPPPLPPTPPPFSANPYNSNSTKPPTPQSYNQNVGPSEFPQTSVSRLAPYPPPPLMPPMVFGNRPASVPMNPYGNTVNLQQGENPHSTLQNLNMHHSLAQLQPLQPPQLTRPPQPPQHLRPPIQSAQQLEQGPSMQNPAQMQMHQLQMPQQPQVSQMHAFYQSQQQEFPYAQQQQQQQHIEHVQVQAQAQALHQQGDAASHQQQDPGMSLHEYFKSPEAIKSLLSDRDKLCQLLEQHPKLMQMLQERLGQL